MVTELANTGAWELHYKWPFTKNSVTNIIFVIQCEKTVLLKDSWLPGGTVQWGYVNQKVTKTT